MTTNLGSKWAKSVDSPSFVALAFRSGLDYRNSDFKGFDGDDLAILCAHLVRTSLVTPSLRGSSVYAPRFIFSRVALYQARVSGLCDGTCRSVCLSVDLSDCKVYCGKTAEWIRMPFEMASGVGRGMGVLDGGGDRRRGMDSFGVNFGRPVYFGQDLLISGSVRRSRLT